MTDFSDGLRKFGEDVKRKVEALPKTVSFQVVGRDAESRRG
jgi:hypothetical protein